MNYIEEEFNILRVDFKSSPKTIRNCLVAKSMCERLADKSSGKLYIKITDFIEDINMIIKTAYKIKSI